VKLNSILYLQQSRLLSKLLIIALIVVFFNKDLYATPKQHPIDTLLLLAPGPNNPRNSEGDFVKLKNGSILFIYSHYTGNSASDHATAYLASRISKDGGKTWSTEDKLEVEQEGTMNVMSVSLLRLQNGKIALFYLRKNSVYDCTPMVRFSEDEALSWSNPIQCITNQIGYFVLNNNRVIQLSSGRLLFAVALHQTFSEKVWHNAGQLYSYYSDDNGITWQQGVEVPTDKNTMTQEPGLVELKDKSILMLIRTNQGVQYQSKSVDGGIHWSIITPTNIASPLSPATIVRIPSTKDLMLVWNNNDGNNPALKGKRTPLSVAISKDEGVTWEKVKNIETNPDGWYCYTAIHFEKRAILLSYCAGSQSQKTHLAVTKLLNIQLDWLYK
jgi:Neuraminidase (sialidase)